jgi:probable HAF family extracellular repeat protein
MELLEDRRLLSYSVITLGSLGGTISVPLGVNNQGEVVGVSYTANNAAGHAFLYRHGRMTDLGTLGGTMSGATDINDRGTVVGMSNIAPGSHQFDAFLERGGKLTDLGPVNQGVVLGGSVSINADGVVSGISAGGFDAFIERHGSDIDLGSLAGLGSLARDLNASGQVVGLSGTGVLPAANGRSQPTVFFHAFRASHGTMSDLGTLGGANSSANSINDRGAVVGYSFTANDAAIHAFLYSHGTMTDLGTLGGRDSVAAAINDKGAVVGGSLTSISANHGFIDQHGRMVDLNSLIPASSGFVITNAQDINDRGQIVAEGYETSAPRDHLAFLLDPTGPTRELHGRGGLPSEARIALASFGHSATAQHTSLAQTAPVPPILSAFPREAAGLATGNPVYEHWTTTYYDGLSRTDDETFVLDDNQTVTNTDHVTLRGTAGTETVVSHFTAIPGGIRYENTVTEPNGQIETETRTDTFEPRHKILYDGSFERPDGVTVTLTGSSVNHGSRTVVNKSFHESNGISYTTHEVEISQGEWQSSATVTTKWSDGSHQVDKDTTSGVILSSPPS